MKTREAIRAERRKRKDNLRKQISTSDLWAQHPKYKNIYVSTGGQIFSIKSASLRKQFKINSGYMCVHVEREINRTVHSLVLESWVGKRPDGFEAAHLNGNKLDNSLENLRWVTKAENQYHRKLHGTDNVGSKHPLSILSEEDLPAVKRLIERGKTQREVGDIFGVSASAINMLIKGKTWTHV